jgi:membrane-bound lytic murein transglycosylase B
MKTADSRQQTADSRRQTGVGVFLTSAVCRLLSAVCILLSAFASAASAEIVVLKNGRTMSVQSFKVVGDMATMTLRSGGEVTFPAGIVARVDPDEVPYPVAGNREPGSGETVPSAEDTETVPAVQVVLIPEAVLAARPFAALISNAAAAYDVDARLVHAVIEQESNYQARARSKKGARGLMQLMPATARQYGVRNSYDPKANIEAGVKHLKSLLDRLELPMALAAYNAGEGTIQRYGGLPPFPETQSYVRSILRRIGR